MMTRRTTNNQEGGFSPIFPLWTGLRSGQCIMTMTRVLLCLCLLFSTYYSLTYAFYSIQSISIGSKSKNELKLQGIKNPLRNVNLQDNIAIKILTKNPISLIITNAYSFFYWFPKKNLPYDLPWTLFRNNTAEWLAWYQLPHNLPPYRYLDPYPNDFFCYGLPGNTLPLGNWDPFSFSQVDKTVVKKYRESELKHGRIAMLAILGCLTQELYHPFFPNIGGMAITHMKQLRELSCSESPLCKLFQVNVDLPCSLEYALLMVLFGSIEYYFFLRNWTRWRGNEYPHQFQKNIGLGNLKADYDCGNYGFDPLNFMPDTEEDRLWIREVELNHGRLAMMAFVGLLFQEYFFGLPSIGSALYELKEGDSTSSNVSIFDAIYSVIQTMRKNIESYAL
jgi:hypothetical protein